VDDSHSRHVVSAHAQRDMIVRSVTRRFGEDAAEHVDEAYAQCCDAQVNDADHAVRWVAQAAKNLAIDAKRGQDVARRHAPQLVAPHSTESAEDRYLEMELYQRVATAVASLPPYQRAVIRAYSEGTRHSEIARRMGRSVDAVKQVISRTLKVLHEQLREAELGVVALWARRRRRASAVTAAAASQAVAFSGPAMAAALNAVVPVMGCLVVAFVLSTSYQAGPPDTPAAYSDAYVATPANSAWRDEGGQAPSHPSPPQTPLVPVPKQLEPVQAAKSARMADTVERLPSSTAIDVPGSPDDLWRKDHDPSAPTGYAPDDDDPVGDLAYCVTHPIVTPSQIACEQPTGPQQP
jgi:RNA polymerase sigma factor (sigma-70 family)